METRVEQQVRQIIADELQRSPSEVHRGASLRKDLGMDSVAAINIVFAIEDALRVPVRFVGVGEAVGDLIPFDPEAFVTALFA